MPGQWIHDHKNIFIFFKRELYDLSFERHFKTERIFIMKHIRLETRVGEKEMTASYLC